MNLIFNIQYQVVENHTHHSGRIGMFQFLGGPKSDVIVLSDPSNNRSLFCVGINDIVDFDPKNRQHNPGEPHTNHQEDGSRRGDV